MNESGAPYLSSRVYNADCGDEISRWLTRYFAAGKTFRMVHYEPEMKPRMSVKIESPFPADEEVEPGFSPFSTSYNLYKL